MTAASHGTAATTTIVAAASASAFLSGAGLVALFYWRTNAQRQRQLRIEALDFAAAHAQLTQYAKGNNDDNNNNETQEEEECIYLDYNGTTPIYPPVLHAMVPYLVTHYGNPSSGHLYGQAPAAALALARQQILKSLLQAEPHEEPLTSIWFTSCGTESDNLAIRLALAATQHGKGAGKMHHGGLPHIVASNVEHPAILACLQLLADDNMLEFSLVPVHQDGRVRVEHVVGAMQPNTVLVTIMLANNESGALQPVRDIAAYCRERGILCHTDAAQAAGKVSLALPHLGHPDMISIVGHKMGAPKGVACLYVRSRCLQERGRSLSHASVLLMGGTQEHGHRGGTENVASIVGFGQAAALAGQHLVDNAAHMETLRARLLHNLTSGLGSDKVKAHGPKEAQLRLPNTLSVGLLNVHSGQLLAAVGHQVAASAGATCHSTDKVSSVLQAMQVPLPWARGTLRLSVGPMTTLRSVDKASEILIEAVQEQWRQQKRDER